MRKKPVRILAREVKALRMRDIVFVKVLWQNYQIEEAMWEQEDELGEKYPRLYRGLTLSPI